MSFSVPDNNPCVVRLRPAELDITSETVGKWLANSPTDIQAAILGWWADAVAKWGPLQSWPQQCRAIAEIMSDEECGWVRSILDSLIEHLEAIPQERRSREAARKIMIDALKPGWAQEQWPGDESNVDH